MSDRNVILIGFMGTGKSAVGRALADTLGYDFVDCDEWIEKRAGKRVSQIFDEDGEPEFRRIESEVIADLPKLKRTVVATGGGAPLRPENMAAMKRAGLVICLTASPEEIYQRVKHDTSRPLLAEAGDLRRRIKELLAQRKSAYEKADVVLDTTLQSEEEVAQQCIDLLARDTRSDT